MATAPNVGRQIDVPAGLAQSRKVGERGLRSRQDDQGGVAGDRLAGPHEDMG